MDIKQRIESLAARSPYGWGHTIDFGDFTVEGLLGRDYEQIARGLDAYEFWPRDLTGLEVADIGCFSGGLSLVMARRGAERVIAVDEIPEHLEQCRLVAEIFDAGSIRHVEASLYELERRIALESLDLILCSGVLYHLSDMLVGLLVMQTLLKPGGVLLLESNAIDDFERSYANFGRFYAGLWWQPSALCIKDMCEFTGYEPPDIRFYRPDRCLARAVKSERPSVPFRRGMTYQVGDIHDRRPRTLDPSIMRPARSSSDL